MLQQIIHRLFRARHYWRSISFDELAELYTSRLLTVFAINIVNLFAAVYLYKLGYSIAFIAFFYAALYAMKIPYAYICARIVAFFGPKHAIFFANMLRILSLVAFALVPQFGLPAVIAFGIFQQLASALYDLAYMVDFSKVKSIDHAGREIGMMQVIEKAARIISPLVGGAIASLFSPQVTIIVAGVVFAFAALPLFRTIEPTETKARIRLGGFPWRLARRTLAAETAVGYDFVASGLTWTLFVSIAVFGASGQTLYAILGGLASLGVLISMAAAWVFGKMVDRRKGGVLLASGAVANTVAHLFRPFTTTPVGAIGINITSETATSAYAMPFTRAVFDVADRSGFRIVYLMFIEMAVNFGAALGCLVLATLVLALGVVDGMKWAFVVAAAYELLLLLARRQAR